MPFERTKRLASLRFYAFDIITVVSGRVFPHRSISLRIEGLLFPLLAVHETRDSRLAR